jgi:S-adenosylmethionine synthetase
MIMNKTYLFTSECVSSGHPDKVADQISDAILDEFLVQDENPKVACETLCTTGLVVVSGEVKSEAYVDVQTVARQTINDIGYNRAELMFDGNSCGVLSTIHEQSPDINRGVDRGKEYAQGAGDQGMMFGYATNESDSYMPLTIDLARALIEEIELCRYDKGVMTYLRPDAKTQVTLEYDSNTHKPVRCHTIVVSVQHDEFDLEEDMLEYIRKDVIKYVIKPTFEQKGLLNWIDDNTNILVNPTGKFVIGGPHGDTGLTGRKIIVDTYGGWGAHGGGAFSGKDPSKVDRSAAYMARYVAKNLVAAGICDRALVQLSYAIGVAEPVSVFVDTYDTAKDGITDVDIAESVNKIFDLRPAAIINKLGLKNPIYLETARSGHFGVLPFKEERELVRDGVKTWKTITYYKWEDTDLVYDIKKYFSF